MATTKEVDVYINQGSWVQLGKQVPIELLDLQRNAPQNLGFEFAMIFLAVWTRPPAQYGFSLSDCWAWMRYFSAIDAGNALRLREEWSAVDPHHKTVLSGDFGVGFTTLALTRALGFVEYIDTLHMVNVLAPGQFRLGRTATRGPRKSPDYVALDRQGGYHVLECKGSQTSRAGLADSVNRGIAQKANLQTHGGVQIGHSLVAGLYVPQWEQQEDALLHICDPEWSKLGIILSEFPREQVNRSAGRILLAKEMAMLEMTDAANALSYPQPEVPDLNRVVEADIVKARTAGRLDGEVRYRRDYLFPSRTTLSPTAGGITGLRFEASLGTQQLESLVQGKSVEEAGDHAFESALTGTWEFSERAGRATARSPLGIAYSLEYLE